MSTCRSCGAPIIWAVTTTGAKMPLDADPDPEGLFVLERGVAVHVIDAKGVDRYTSHFATCPDAASHRKAKPKGTPPSSPERS